MTTALLVALLVLVLIGGIVLLVRHKATEEKVVAVVKNEAADLHDRINTVAASLHAKIDSARTRPPAT